MLADTNVADTLLYFPHIDLELRVEVHRLADTWLNVCRGTRTTHEPCRAHFMRHVRSLLVTHLTTRARLGNCHTTSRADLSFHTRGAIPLAVEGVVGAFGTR